MTSAFSEEGPIPRPGYKYPWVYVIQENDAGPGFLWGVYSQQSIDPFFEGESSTVEQARAAARAAVEIAERLNISRKTTRPSRW